MTSSAPRIESSPIRGFSLPEVIVASALSGLVLSAVLSTFLFIGRTGLRSASYSTMEAETRRGMAAFARDVRRATAIQWNGPQSLVLTMPGDSNARVTYAYEPGESGSAPGNLVRLDSTPGADQPRQILIHRVSRDFAFRRYKLERVGAEDLPAANDLETKQVQIVLRTVAVTGDSTAGATQSAISARFVLRNKRVSN